MTFLLEPGKRPLGLTPGDIFFDRSATVFLRLPDPLGDLRSAPTLTQLLLQGVRIIPFTCRDDFEALARATPFAGVHLDRIKQRHDLNRATQHEHSEALV